jgi:suppressor of G2 allele of SKP1
MSTPPNTPIDTADHFLSPEAAISLGDAFFVDKDYEEALDAYAIALSMITENSTSSQTRFRAYSHKAEALLQLSRYQEALDDSSRALSDCIVPGLRSGETEACLARKARALCHLQRYAESLQTWLEAQQLAGLNRGNKDRYSNDIRKCRAEMEKKSAKSSSHDEDADMLVVEEVDRKAPKLQPSTEITPSTSKNPVMPKYQYYQSDAVMTIAILEPNLTDRDLNVTFGKRRLTAIVRKQGYDFTVICGKLFDKIIPNKCKVVCKPEKVLIKLRKQDTIEWHELMSKTMDDSEDDQEMDSNDEQGAQQAVNTGVPLPKPIPRPYASHRDWDAIERDLKNQEAQEKPEGEEAMNALFRQIYAKADEDTRRAMIKSYQTSGGTVLSTNWNEVKEKDYEKEREAPKGMEWKTWEGDKVTNISSNKN